MTKIKTILIVSIFLIISFGTDVHASAGLDPASVDYVILDYASYAPRIPKEKIPADIPRRLKKLIEMLYSPSIKEKTYALEMLLKIEKENAPALPFVISMLEDLYDIEEPHEESTDMFTAQLAADLLSNSGDPNAIKPLIYMLVNKNKAILGDVLIALRKLDYDWINSYKVNAILPSLIKSLSSKKIDFEDKIELINRLCEKKYIDENLIGLYKDELGDTKAFTAFMIDRLSSGWMDTKTGKSFAPELIKGLKDKNKDVQFYSAKILKKMGHKPENKLLLIRFYILTKNDEELVKIGKEAIKPLVTQIKKVDDLDSLIWTQNTLSKIYRLWRKRKDAKNMVPYFIEKLNDNDTVRLKIAIEFLGGMRDTRAVNQLSELLNKEDMQLAIDEKDITFSTVLINEKDIKISIIKALEKIGDERAIKPLFDALSCNYPEAKSAAFKALQKFEWEPKDLEEKIKLIVAIRDKNKISEIGISSRKAIVKMLLDYKGYSKKDAAFALELIGWEPKTEEEKIAKYVVDEDWDKLIEMGVPATKEFIDYILYTGHLKYEFINKPEIIAKIGGSEIVDTLIPILKNKDRLLRKFAADILVKIGDKRAMEPLIDLLMDEEIYNSELEDIWSYTSLEPAARAMGQFGDPRAIEPLIHVLGFGSRVSRAASESLVKIGEPAKERIIELLKDKDPLVAINAIDILVKMKDMETVKNIMIALEHENPKVKYKAAIVLGEIADDRAIDPLIEVIDKISLLDRGDVFKIMFKLDPNWTSYDVAGDVVPILGEDLDSYDEDIKKRSINLLGKIGDSEAIDYLIDAFKIEENSRIKESILTVLDKLNWDTSDIEDEIYYYVINENERDLLELGNFAIEPLVEILKDKNIEFREFAALALRMLKWKPETLEEKVDLSIADKKWEDVIKICIEETEIFDYVIKDRDSDVKESLIKAMSKIEDSDIDDMLIIMLDDKDINVQLKALNALVKKKNSDAVKYVLPFLKDKRSSAKITAAKILQKIGDPFAIKPIIDVFAYSDIKTSESIIKVLIKFGPLAVEPLIEALKDENENVRLYVVETLGMIGDPQAVEPLAFAIKRSDTILQQKIIEALAMIGDSAAVKPLIILFKEESLDIKVKAADALYKLEPNWTDNDEVKSLVPELIVGLKEKDKSKLYKVISLIGMLNDPRVYNPLIDLVVDMKGVWDVKTQAAEALSNINPDWVNDKRVKKAVPYFIGIIKGNKPGDNVQAINLLGEIGDQRAVKPLIEALSEYDISKNVLLSKALKKITKAKIGPDYEYWHKWWDKNKAEYSVKK